MKNAAKILALGLATSELTPATYLALQNIAVNRGARPVLRGLNLQVKASEAWAVTGANGAGKSTLLRLLAGLVSPIAGSYKIAEYDHPAQACHYLGHLDGLKNARILGEEIAYQAALYHAPSPDRGALLVTLGLPIHADMPVGDLSAGQRRRLTFARLLLAPRPLWLLDEPLTGLDGEGRILVERLVEAHIARGGMVVAAAHETLAFADHTLTLESL